MSSDLTHPSLEMPPRLPPYAVRELYDNFLRNTLERFFEHVLVERTASTSSPRDPAQVIGTAGDETLTIEWLGWRYLLRLPHGRRFSPNEIRLASAIVLALGARYRAVLNPDVMADKGDLFRGATEDRVVGAFLDPRPYMPDAPLSLIDRIAPALDVLRIAAVSSYENRPISTGILLLGSDDFPRRSPARTSVPYWELLSKARSLFRLANGVSTLFLVDKTDVVVDVIDIARWADEAAPPASEIPGAQAYVPHARATLVGSNVCLVLSPWHEMKVFAEGAQLFTFRNASWRLLDLQARFEQWASTIASRPLAERLFRTALDLADAREGALFVILRNPAASAGQLLAVADRLDLDVRFDGADNLAARRDLLRLLAGRSVVDLDANVLCALAGIDGAIVTDSSGLLLAAGAILRHPPVIDEEDAWIAEGARTTAALFASRFGPVLKVSEDGVISFFDAARIWEI